MTKSFRILNLGAALLAAGMLFLPAMASAQPPDPELINPHKVPLTPEVERIIEMRMRDVAMCWHAWLEATFPTTEAQRGFIKGRINEEFPEQLKNAKFIAFHRANNVLPEGFPVHFARTGCASAISNLTKTEDVRQSSSVDQLIAFIRALNEREASQLEANKDYLLAIVDFHVVLSDGQWETLAKDKNFLRDVASSPFHALDPLGGYFGYYELCYHDSLIDQNILDDGQKHRLLKKDSHVIHPPQSIRLNSTTRQELNREIEEHLLRERPGICIYLDARIARLAEAYSLTEQQIAQLRTTAKGVSVKTCDAVLDATLQRFDFLEELASQGQPVSPRRTMQSVFAPGDPLEHPLWMETWTAILREENQPSSRRVQRVQNARDRAVVAMLDHELWLTPPQREQMLVCFSEVLPPLSMINPTQEHLRDITWVVHVLVLADEQRLREILNEPQFKSWQHMKAMLPVVKEPAPNVTIRLKNNGLLEIPLRIPNAKSMPE